MSALALTSTLEENVDNPVTTKFSLPCIDLVAFINSANVEIPAVTLSPAAILT